MMSDVASKMVQTCSEHNDVERSLELLDLLFECGFVKSGAFDPLSQLVNSYINKYEVNFFCCVVKLEILLYLYINVRYCDYA